MRQIKDTIAKIIMALLSIFGGMICGAVIIYFLSGIIYLAVYGSGPVENNYACARGMAIGYISIFSGGLLGAALGSVGALKYLKSFEKEHRKWR